MREVKAYVRWSHLGRVLEALRSNETLPGVTCTQVEGFGRAEGAGPRGPGTTTMQKLEIVVQKAQVPCVVDILLKHAHTGQRGDGMIFVTPVESAIHIRSGESRL